MHTVINSFEMDSNVYNCCHFVNGFSVSANQL